MDLCSTLFYVDIFKGTFYGIQILLCNAVLQTLTTGLGAYFIINIVHMKHKISEH